MKRFPWKEFAPVPAALICLGVAWAVARGVLNERVGGVVNAPAALAAVVVVPLTAWWGSKRISNNRTSGAALEGTKRSALIDGVRSHTQSSGFPQVCGERGR